jgi:hypothetical protein
MQKIEMMKYLMVLVQMNSRQSVRRMKDLELSLLLWLVLVREQVVERGMEPKEDEKMLVDVT